MTLSHPPFPPSSFHPRLPMRPSIHLTSSQRVSVCSITALTREVPKKGPSKYRLLERARFQAWSRTALEVSRFVLTQDLKSSAPALHLLVRRLNRDFEDAAFQTFFFALPQKLQSQLRNSQATILRHPRKKPLIHETTLNPNTDPQHLTRLHLVLPTKQPGNLNSVFPLQHRFKEHRLSQRQRTTPLPYIHAFPIRFTPFPYDSSLSHTNHA